ncbi:MAG TPA: hypothetical protein VGP07_10475 [Polyangia bacterium]|jgi:hypothetical protein
MRRRLVTFSLMMMAAASGACAGTPATSSNDAPPNEPVDAMPAEVSPPEVPQAEVSPPRFCDGAPSVADSGPLTAPFVTFDDGTGACVFTTGDQFADARACGGGPGASAMIEPGCPSTSLLIDVWTSPFVSPQFFIQGGYAFTQRNGELLRNGRVVEMTIDSTMENVISGHFQIALDPTSTAPAMNATGTFALCATTGLTVEPCRDM